MSLPYVKLDYKEAQYIAFEINWNRNQKKRIFSEALVRVRKEH